MIRRILHRLSWFWVQDRTLAELGRMRERVSEVERHNRILLAQNQGLRDAMQLQKAAAK